MIGIYYICTGSYKVMFQSFLDSAVNFAPSENKTIILLCDSLEKFYDNTTNIKIESHYIQDLPWPLVTLMKMNYIYQYKKDLFDYVFYFNADFQFTNSFRFEKYDFVTALPPNWNGDNFTYLSKKDDNCFSNAYIGDHRYKYSQGGFFGGKAKIVYSMCANISEWVREDLLMNIIPRWHDESYLNKWVYLNEGKYNINHIQPFRGEEHCVDIIKPESFIPKKDNNKTWKYDYSDIYNTFGGGNVSIISKLNRNSL